MKTREDEKNRLSPKTKGTDQIPIVGREDKGDLLKLLGRQGAFLDALDDVIEDGQPLSSGTSRPNMDVDYMMREAARQKGFQSEFGEAYNRDYAEVDTTDAKMLNAASTRNLVTIRTQELPENEGEAAGPILGIRRETTVLEHPVDPDATAKVRVTVPMEVPATPLAETEEVEVENRTEAARQLRHER